MAKKLNSWYAFILGISSIISGCISIAKYIERVIMTEKQSTTLLIGGPFFILVLLGLGYVLVRVGIGDRK
jgi:hypothetical protein